MNSQTINKIVLRFFLPGVASFLFISSVFSSEIEKQITKDPHRAQSGFFDMHICNWPDRHPFYLTLFGTTEYADITSIEVFAPDNSKVGELDLSKFTITKKTRSKPERHVFLTQLKLHKNKLDGWYQAKINFKNKASQTANDFVIHQTLSSATDFSPEDGAEDIKIPEKLSWAAIKGAAFYQVFIRDLWADNKLILSSDLLKTNTYQIPIGLLKPGGNYSWKVHSRDLNEHVQLGDFNIGSLSQWVGFSIAD